MDTIRICKQCRQPLPANAPEGLCPQCLAKVGLGTEPAAPGATINVSPLADAAPGVHVPPEVAQLSAQFPQLEILELLGMGGMGMVYKARQPRLDRLVALKILPLDSMPDPSFAERFEREAKALAKLNHPGIVTLYDFGQTREYYYFIMEFVDGMNLRQLIRSKTLEPRQALELVTQICTALQFAHDEKIVHRDIKPENILITKKGQVKIADFGLAKLLGAAPDTALTLSQAAMGTFNYMAPEQREDAQKVDHRADIYSLGVVFYEMLTGEVPMGRFEPPSKKVQVDVRLDEVVLHALEREPARRYQQASEVKSGVETIASNMLGGPPSLAGAGKPGTFQPKAPPGLPTYLVKGFGTFAVCWLIIALFLRWAFLHWQFLGALVTTNQQSSVAEQIRAVVVGTLFMPFSFDLAPYLLPFAFATAIYAWLEAREARGLKLRQLPPALRRKMLLSLGVVAGAYVALMLAALGMTLTHGVSTRQATTHEWWYAPKSGGFEKLGLRATFSSFQQGDSTFYQAPKSCPVTLTVYRSDEQEHPSMDVTLPGLRCAYRIPQTNSWAYSSVLDKDTLVDWLHRGAGLNPNGSNFQAQASELYTLLRRYENEAPHTADEFHNAADKDLAEFGFGGFTYNANFGAGGIGGGIFSGSLPWVLVAGTLLYFFVTFRVTRRIYAVAWSEIAAGRWTPPQKGKKAPAA